jgi:DNA-binding transcriptional ArsR family regulator
MISEALHAGAHHHLRPIDRLVLMVFAHRAAWGTSVQCEQKEIAQATGLSARAIIQAIQRLTSAGLLAVEPCGKSRQYRLNLQVHRAHRSRETDAPDASEPEAPQVHATHRTSPAHARRSPVARRPNLRVVGGLDRNQQK